MFTLMFHKRSQLLSEVCTVTFKLSDTVSDFVFCLRKFLGSLMPIDFSFGLVLNCNAVLCDSL